MLVSKVAIDKNDMLARLEHTYETTKYRLLRRERKAICENTQVITPPCW